MAVGALTYHPAIFIFLSVRHEIYWYKIWPKFLQSKNCYLNFEPSRHMINSPTSIRIEYFSILFPYIPLRSSIFIGASKVSNLGEQFWHHEGMGIPLEPQNESEDQECIIIYQVWCLMELLHLLSRFWKWQEVLCESDHIHQQRLDALQLPLFNQVRLGLHTTRGPTKRSL